MTHELSSGRAQPVAAIVYADEVYPDALFKTLVKRCRELGLSLAGVLQHRALEGGDRRCDVVLEDLATGHRTALKSILRSGSIKWKQQIHQHSD